MATVEALEQPLPMPKSNGSDGLFVVSLSPATFDKCWWGAGPGDPGNQLDSSLKGTVETAVIGRPLRIGGWDSAQNAPRPLAPYTPPGTVWWLHSRGGGAAGLIQIGQSTAYGYGLAIVGGSSARSGS